MPCLLDGRGRGASAVAGPVPRGLLPVRWRLRRRPRLWQELLFVGVAYELYSLVRNSVPTGRADALARAADVLRLERLLHVNPELAVNKAVAGAPWLAQLADYYYATLHFSVTIGVLVWVYQRHPLQYRTLRRVLMVTTLLALLGFWLCPLAPPRLMPGAGYVDTIVRFHTWGSWGTSSVASHSNQLAAMPSLHVAWSLWSAYALVRLSPHRWVKVLAVLYPFCTLLVTVGTANHFVLDAVGGALVLMAGMVVQRVGTGMPAVDPAAQGARADPPAVTVRADEWAAGRAAAT